MVLIMILIFPSATLAQRIRSKIMIRSMSKLRTLPGWRFL